MLKISLFVLAISVTCHGGRLPFDKRFQRQEFVGYPPSGFRPSGDEFELPSENLIPEVSAEQLELNNFEMDSFNRLKTKPNVRSEKLTQKTQRPNKLNQLRNKEIIQPSLQQGSPAKIQDLPVQQSPQNSPLTYIQPNGQFILQQPRAATSSQPDLQTNFIKPNGQFTNQQSAFGPAQVFLQPNGQLILQQPTEATSSQPELQNNFIKPNGQFTNQQPAFGPAQVFLQPNGQFTLQQSNVGNNQPAVDLPNQQVLSTQFQQPITYYHQPSYFGTQTPVLFGGQDPALFSGQQVLQNYC